MATENRCFVETHISRDRSGEHQIAMRVHLGTMASLLVLAAIQGFAENQTQFNLTEEKTLRKRDGKKQVPTFVGSDGVVRKVSPSAILDEMKRCLPPGLLIPKAVWPELPPNLGETAEENELPEEDQDGNTQKKTEFDVMPGSSVNGMENEHNLREGKKRVMRSDAAVKNRSDDFGAASGDGLNVKLEMPARESVIFSPTEPNQKKFADVLKEMFSKFDRNSTGFDMKYVDEGAVVDQFKKKFKPRHAEDYQDYDYEEGVATKQVAGRVRQRDRTRMRKSKHSGKRRGAVKSYDVPFKMASKARRSRGGKDNGNLPDYDYDYDGTAEDSNVPEDDSKEFRVRTNRQTDLEPEDELGRQIELNEYLGALTKRLADAEDEGLDVEKQQSKIAKYSARVGTMDQTKDYKQILATVMELNSSLVRLLERAIFSAICQKGAKTEEPNKICRTDDRTDRRDDDSSATSFLLECMELLMQKRKGLRAKRDHDSALTRTKDHELYQTETQNVPQLVEDSKRTKHHSKTPVKTTDLNLLKWLLKWYLTVSM